MMKTTKYIEPHSQEWWNLKAYEDTYQKPRISLHNFLSWFEVDELRELKKEVTDSFIERLRAIPKPKPTKDPNLKWVQDSFYQYQLDQGS